MSTEVRPPGTLARIDRYSHHFSVTGFGGDFRQSLLEYCRTMAQYGLIRTPRGKFVKGMVRVFVGVTKDRSSFRFHINQYEDFLMHISRSGYSAKQLWVVDHPIYTPVKVEYDWKDKREPRDYQGPIIDYGLEEGNTKVVTLDPGRGKTFIACTIIRDLETRVFISINAKYIKKWIGDIEESFDMKKGDIMVIQGSASLKRFLELAVAGELEAKVIICSATTLFNYLKHYEFYSNKVLELGYACLPWELWEKAGIGLRLIDEVHENPHFNFRLDLHSNIPKALSLSGTLISKDETISRIYSIMFPPEKRYKTHDRDVYIAAEALMYSLPNAMERVKYMNHGRKSYSHVKFEQSIMKNKTLQKDYLGMIADIADKRFVEIREKGQKMAIYFSTIDMCTKMAEVLKKLHPDLKVTRYTGEDDYEEMLENDIIVTTLKSLGTAIDVPGLLVVLMTDALDSIQANLQCMGRLRRLKDWPDLTPLFLFLVCGDIQKHVKYYENKKDLFKGRVVGFTTTYTGYRI